MPTRLLKPGVRDSASIDALSPLCEVLFYRLLVTVDDFGRFDARPSMIKAHCFPVKEAVTAQTCSNLLHELVRAGLAVVYEVDGKPYLQMLKWDNTPRSKVSKYPAPSSECKQVFADAGPVQTDLPVFVTVTVTDTVTETGTISGPVAQSAPSAQTAEPDAPELPEDPPEFVEAWSCYPKRAGGNSRKDALKAWKSRVKAGADPAAMLAGVRRYAAYCTATEKVGTEYVKQAATFFGPGDHYLAEWAPPKAAGKGGYVHDLGRMDYTKGVGDDGRF